jgi:hypothetical protein
MINETLTIEESKEIIEYYSTCYPLTFKAMHFIGLGGVATAGQVFRWLNYHESDKKKCFLAITALMGKNLIRKLSRSQLKHTNQAENEIIFFLTEKGFNELKKRCLRENGIRNEADLIINQVKYGSPTGIKLDRVNHELLVAESILYWLKDYDFIFIKTESDLLSEYYKSWHEEKKRYKKQSMGFSPPPGMEIRNSPPGRSFSDYQIYMLQKEDGEFWYVNCEIVHKMTLTQIQKKTNVHVWFCNNQKVSNLIKSATNGTPIILDNLHEPPQVRDALQTQFYAKNITSDAQKAILMKIAQLGGVASCKLLAAMGIKKEAYYRNQLEQLYRQKEINKVSSCLVPGISRGNNQNFYFLKNIDSISNQVEIKIAVMRIHLMLLSLAKGYQFSGYNQEFDGCIYIKDKVSYLFLVDYEHESVEQTILRIYKTQQLNPKFKIGIACLNEERCVCFHKNNPELLIWKLYKLRKAQSYRFLTDLRIY